jgi:TolB-like protein
MASFHQRLKDRKLVQWAIAYLAGAWVVYEVSSTVGGHWGLPDGFFRALFVVLGVGFAGALILAWYHGEKGRQRVSGPELLMLTALFVIAAGLLAVIRDRDGGIESAPRVVVGGGADDRPAIAVLPCDNLSPDSGDAYLAAGIHEEILLSLQRIPTLLSIGRTSVLQYGDSPPGVTQIGTELGVGFLGECSVRKDGARMRLTFQLLDAASGAQLWAENYDRELTAGSLFEVQGDIASRIAREMSAFLDPEAEAQVRALATESNPAYEAYLRGQSALRGGGLEALMTAAAFYEEALDADPGFAEAYAGLADVYIMSAHRGLPASEAFQAVERAASRAIALDPTLPGPHAALADMRYHYYWDWEGAEMGFRRALELGPDLPYAHTWYSGLLAARGDLAGALREMQIANRVDPRSLGTGDMSLRMLYYDGQYEEMIRRVRESQGELENQPMATRAWLARALSRLGRADEGAALLGEVQADASAEADRLSARVMTMAAAGRMEEARASLADLEALRAESHVPAYVFTLSHAALGDLDGAFQWLDRAFEERNAALIWLNVHPDYAPLKADPRFADALARMNLPGLEG